MKKYIIGLIILLARNVCAMEQQLPFELQKHIFGIMVEKYNAEKELFIEERVCEIKHCVDRGNNKERWMIEVDLKDDYASLLKSDVRQLLHKAEHHSFCQKDNKDKVLELYGCNYIKNTQQLKNYNYFPVSLDIIDMREKVTVFVEEYYNPIIMFWYIIRTKPGAFL